MSGSVLTWIAANKEWCFGAICSIAGGMFAFFKWFLPQRRKHTLKAPEQTDASPGKGGALTMKFEGSVVGGVIAGSNNVQTVVVNQAVEATRTPIRDRRPSSPTANEIRQRQSSALEGIPLYLRSDTRKNLLDSNIGLKVEWPIRLSGVWKTQRKTAEDILTVHARYGDENWGAFIKFEVEERHYPVLKTLHEGHKAFVEGQIIAIDDYMIEIGVASLEFE